MKTATLFVQMVVYDLYVALLVTAFLTMWAFGWPFQPLLAPLLAFLGPHIVAAGCLTFFAATRYLKAPLQAQDRCDSQLCTRQGPCMGPSKPSGLKQLPS